MEPGIWNDSYAPRFQKRVSILLGLKHFHSRSLTRIFEDNNLELVPDSSITALGAAPDDALELADLGEVEVRLRPSLRQVPPTDVNLTAENEQRLFTEISFLEDNALTDSILQHGIYLDRYRVGTTEEKGESRVMFRRDQRELWWQLANYPTAGEAEQAVNNIRRLLVRLSVESEGLHVVEHIILRPRNFAPDETSDDLNELRDFYSFRISVFFPDWTAKFRDPNFRRLAEETVQTNCPAHVYPEFHWLDFPAMRRFETLYQQWVGAKYAAATEDTIDNAAEALVQFIREFRAEGSDAQEGEP